MKSKDIYSEEDKVQWQPYVYKLTLSKGEEEYYYIGSRSSKREQVNPKELLNCDYNSSSKTVHKLIEEGWECKRKILYTFSGTREGAMECCKKEKELLNSVKAAQSDQWLNMHNGGAMPHVHSQEFSEKISKALKGRNNGPMSEETKRRMSEAHKGKKHTAEAKKKMSEARKGVRLSEETKKRMSIAKQNMSEETKKKISEARRGKRFSEETKRKMSIAKQNMSEETKKKMSEARKKYWAEKKAKKSKNQNK